LTYDKLDTQFSSELVPVYPCQFRPEATHDLVRMGAKFDGGYVLPARIPAATGGLLSFGLSDEWTFEEEFSRQSGCSVVCFDPSVTKWFWFRKFLAGIGRGVRALDITRIRRGLRYMDYRHFFDGRHNRHIKAPIGNLPGAVSLERALGLAKLDGPLFLKMDIEGSEYRILPALVEHRSRFTGMAIEFHEVDLHEDRIVRFISDISGDFALVHFHANSHTTILPDGRALVVELTFMNRSLLVPGESLEHRALPIPGLDAPNLPGEVDAPVTFAGST
jgi:hypothetical protein